MSVVCEITVVTMKMTIHSSGLVRRECPVHVVVVVVVADVVAAGVVVDSSDEDAIVVASADPM